MRNWLFVVAIAGCGSNNNMNGDDVDASQGSGSAKDAAVDAPVLAPFGERMPQVVNLSANGGFIAAPKVMAITWANDTLRTDYETFFTQYAASTAWPAQASEYGIGALTVATPGRIATNAPATLNENGFIQILKANLTGANPAWGAPDANTLYEVSIPTSLMYDDGNGSKCCTDYYGYHFDTKINGVDVPFAINCACADQNLTALQNLTETANHETVEAASDPLIAGFAQADNDHVGWTYTTDGEIADFCEYADTANLLMPSGMTYAIQRTWSNVEARAGHDPCVPSAAADYYQTMPDAPDAATVDVFDTLTPTHLDKIAKGASGMLALHVYASGSYTGPFQIHVDDWNAEFQQPALLTFVQPTGTYMAGDTVMVPVTVVNTDSGLNNAAEAYQITTKPMTGGGPSTYFYGLVGQ